MGLLRLTCEDLAGLGCFETVFFQKKGAFAQSSDTGIGFNDEK